MNIAFFAPIKPPDHPIPSGDRLIAGNLVSALELAGHQVSLASRYICYSKRSGIDILDARKTGAEEEAKRIIAGYENSAKSERPAIWITYHPYCKAPDWIGPLVSRALNIPYITIEAAKTGQGQNDEWRPWRLEAQAGILQADKHLYFKPTDRDYLIELLGNSDRLSPIPAFIDANKDGLAKPLKLPVHWESSTPVLVTAGMMRKGKKDKNFFILAEALAKILDESWNLIVIGGGPEEAAIKQAFSGIPDARIHWTGQVEHEDVLRWMRASDIFIWPGWKEPIGMVYLEAQLQELPVIAFSSMGVPLVVEDGTTGLLAEENNLEELSRNVTTLLSDGGMRAKMGKSAREKVLTQHSLEAAATALDACISVFN